MRRAVAGGVLVLATVLAAGTPAATWSEERAIFTAEAAQKKLVRYRRSTGFWTPDLADVLALEQRLPDYIHREFARHNREVKSSNPLWERAKTYKRQYFGVRQTARRVIWANFFCTDLGHDWRTEPFHVNDGGDCFFNVEYDVAKGTFSWLFVNGNA